MLSHELENIGQGPVSAIIVLHQKHLSEHWYGNK